MIIDAPGRFESFGAVRIYDVIRVRSLSGPSRIFNLREGIVVDHETIMSYASRTAIVVPVKDEDPLTLENVLRAVPYESPLILVSNSSRDPVDRYLNEVEIARSVHASTGREIILVHQKDPAWGEVLEGTSLEGMLDNGLVRSGKGEGMILGVLVAAGVDSSYVGFIDSDNYVPGAAYEYGLIYYTGFAIADTQNVMVRILWPFKGKLASSDIYLRKRGRVSQNTNNILNYALSLSRKIETDIIKTGNSGEHAMSLNLALGMKWAGGFAAESYQLVYLLEACYLVEGGAECPFAPEGVKILQVESRNPHIHAERGDEHISDMISTSMSTIYHSKLGSPEVRSLIRDLLKSYGITGEPRPPRVYSLDGINASKIFSDLVSLSNQAYYFEQR